MAGLLCAFLVGKGASAAAEVDGDGSGGHLWLAAAGLGGAAASFVFVLFYRVRDGAWRPRTKAEAAQNARRTGGIGTAVLAVAFAGALGFADGADPVVQVAIFGFAAGWLAVAAVVLSIVALSEERLLRCRIG